MNSKRPPKVGRLGLFLLVASLSVVVPSYAIAKQARNDDSPSQSQVQPSQSSQQQLQQLQQLQQVQPQQQSQQPQQQQQQQSQQQAQPQQPNVGSQLSQGISAANSGGSISAGPLISSSSNQNGQYTSAGYQNNQVASSGQSYAPKVAAQGYQVDSGLDQNSYQAAAQSVNMALANSGYFSSAPGSGSPSQQVQQGQQQQQQSAAGSALNPLHYYYYPAKEGGSVQQQQQQQASPKSASAPSSGLDMMSSASSSVQNNYQPYAAAYSDQLGSATGLQPDMAASGQEPAYLPQPGGQMDSHYQQSGAGSQMGQQDQLMSGMSFASGQQQQQQSQQISNNNNNNNNINNNYNQHPQQQAQVNQMMNQNQFGGQGQNEAGSGSHVSFGGPSAGGHSSDFLSSQGANLYSQLASELAGANAQYGNQQQQQSASNNANSAASMMSSYLASLAAANQPSSGGQSAAGGVDLFGSQPFSSAASQLSASSVAPPMGQGYPQSSSQASSGLLSAASSLFNSANQQQQQQQQSPSSALFSGPSSHYLNSFLSAASNSGGQQQVSQSYNPFASLLSAGSSADQSMAGSSGSSSSLLSSAGSGGPISAASNSSKRFGLSSFIMPMLALAGLSLLIPTMSNIGTAVGRRKKRSVAEAAGSRQQQIDFEPANGANQAAKELSIGEYMDKIERYYAIYKDAVENDDCMNRLICEFGDAVKDLTAGKAAVVTILERMVPNWMTGKVHLFKEAALESREGKERCKKYICNSNGAKRGL